MSSFADTLDDPTDPSAPTKRRRFNPLQPSYNLGSPGPGVDGTILGTGVHATLPDMMSTTQQEASPDLDELSRKLGGSLYPGGVQPPAAGGNPQRAATATDMPLQANDIGGPARPVALARASLADQPSTARVNELTSKIQQESQPSWKRALTSMIPFVGPVMAGQQRRQLNTDEDLLNTARVQQEEEFQSDAANRRLSTSNALEQRRMLQDIQEQEKTRLATSYDASGYPSQFQYDPQSGRYDLPAGQGKPAGPAFQITRHPTTQAPIGVTRRNGQVVYDANQMTPEEKQAFDADNNAYQTGIATQQKLQAQKDADALTRTIAAVQAGVTAANSKTQNNAVDKAYQDASDAKITAQRMHELEERANAGDAQADLALLANHLGMTMGQIKGARMNQAVIREAAKARGLGNGDAEVGWFQHIMSGNLLAPEQRHQMVELGDQGASEAVQKADKLASLYGVAKPAGRNLLDDVNNSNQNPSGGGNVEEYVRDPKTHKLVKKVANAKTN